MPGDLGSFAPMGLDLSAITGLINGRLDLFEGNLMSRFTDLTDAVGGLKTTVNRVADQLADLLANGALTTDQAAVLDAAIADLRGQDTKLEAIVGADPVPGDPDEEPAPPVDEPAPPVDEEPAPPVDEPAPPVDDEG